MKTSEIHAAARLRGLFNVRALRAAALLPAFTAGALCAAETAAPIPDATVTAKRPGATPAPVAPAPTGNPSATPASSTAAVAPVGAAPTAKPVPAPVKTASAASGETQKIPETVVVASRSEEKLSDVSPSVSKVSAEDMRTRGQSTLVDALQGQQGVYLAQSGGTGAQTSVFTRGNNSKSTAFLLDGRRLNPGFGGSYEITRYTTDNLGSVQVNRGASSTLYGANALGGVVDMRTVDPLAAKTNGGFAEVEAGSFGLVRGKMQVVGNTDNSEAGKSIGEGVGASVGASILDTQNNRENNDFRQVSVTPRVDYRISDTATFDIVSQYSRNRLGLPGSSGGTGAYDPDDYVYDEGFLVSPGLKFDNGDDFKAQIFYSASNTRTDGLQTPAFGSPNYTYVMQKNELTAFAEYSPEKHVKLSAGYTYENSFYRTNSAFVVPGGQSGVIESNSPWARVTVYPVENLTLGAGIRYDDYNRFSGQATYEGFGSYRIAPTDTVLHARVSTGYRAPAPSDFAFGTVGKLSPEESTSYEAGIRQSFFSEKAHLGAVVYDNELKNLIGFDGVTFFTYNIDRARTRGLELSADVSPERHVKFFVNGEFLDARSLTDTVGGEQAGQRLVRRPDWTATAGFEVYPLEKLTIGFSTTFVHGREDAVFPPPFFARTQIDMGDYILGRVYTNWRVTEHFEVFGRVENVFNDKYDSAAVNFDALPIGAFGGIRLLF